MGSNIKIKHKKIEKLQEKCAKKIIFSNFNSDPDPLLTELKFCRVRDVISIQQLKVAYEFCNDLLPSDLRNLFTYSRDIQTTNLNLTSNINNHLYLPTIHNVNSGNLSLKSAVEWFYMSTKVTINGSCIPNISLIKNIHQFKRITKKHFNSLHIHQ